MNLTVTIGSSLRQTVVLVLQWMLQRRKERERRSMDILIYELMNLRIYGLFDGWTDLWV
jgi:hypothetical protein